MRGSLPRLRKCSSVWKSASNNSVTNAAPNQVLSHGLLKILNTELWEIASHLHMWQVTVRLRDTEAGRMDGDSGVTVTDWTGYPMGANSSRERAWEGKGKRVFFFCISAAATHRFSIRWQMTRFTPCTLQISLSTSPSLLLPPTPTSPLHLATASSQFYPPPTTTTHFHIHPYIVYFPVSVSSSPALKL